MARTFTAAFASVSAVSLLLLWLTGYDFDERNWAVAAWALFTIVSGVLAGIAAIAITEERSACK